MSQLGQVPGTGAYKDVKTTNKVKENNHYIHPYEYSVTLLLKINFCLLKQCR